MKRRRSTIIYMILVLTIIFVNQTYAGTYWVSPDGAASWEDACSDTPLDGAAAASLSIANSSAKKGDIIILRGGTYNSGIRPANSGQKDNQIVYRAYDNEEPIITGEETTGIRIAGKEYIKIDGITVSNVKHLMQLVDGACYNEIVNCDIHNGGLNGNAGVIIWSMTDRPSSNNWIHNCNIYGAGYVNSTTSNDEGFLIKIGIFNHDNSSGNNTFENNHLYWGGHHILETNTPYNVFRNNISHNEGWMSPNESSSLCTDSTGKYGNRNFGIDGAYNLVENNRFGHAGLPSDGNGSDGIAIADRYNIIRYNYIYNNGEDGAYFRYGYNIDEGMAAAEKNVFYNNTLYHNGYHDDCRNNMPRRGIQFHGVWAIENTVINNLLWDNKPTDNEISYTGYGDNAVNWPTNVIVNNWLSNDGDPLFVNTDISDPFSDMLPDLSLDKDSPCINGGINLTNTVGDGVNSDQLIVKNAHYFQDGSWGSSLTSLDADLIAIGTVDNVAEISSIDYENNLINLLSPISWSDGDKVWLYKNSGGEIVLNGSAPDLGAYESKVQDNKDEDNTYWVSPEGTAAWNDARSTTPLDGTAASSLITANNNVKAGDTVYLREGTYDSYIFPGTSGTDLDNRIIYSAYNDEEVILENSTEEYGTYYYGILLQNRSYIKVNGIKVVRVNNKGRLLMITYGSSYNEISYCDFDGNGGGNVMIWDGISSGSTGNDAPCVHNWIHHCIIHETGSLGIYNAYVNDNGGMQIGVPSYDNHSNHNTIEDCVFYSGGHHNLETYTKYNVIRNNYFHHEGSMPNNTGIKAKYGPDENGLWGNRNIQIYDGYNEDKWNLLEGNRFGPSGPPPDDDGGNGMVICAPMNILRYNEVYGAQNNGVYFKVGAGSISDNNRFYNNTIYRSGRFNNEGPLWQGYNIRQPGGYSYFDISSIKGTNGVVTVTVPSTNRLKPGEIITIDDTDNYNGNFMIEDVNATQIFYTKNGTYPEEISGTARGKWPTVGNVLKNNIVYGSYSTAVKDWMLEKLQPDYNDYSNNLCTISSPYASVVGDPLFVDDSISVIPFVKDGQPDLSLKSDSPAINKATNLTYAVGQGTSSTTLLVDDAKYFQDGTWGSALSVVQPDWIAIGTVNNVVEISSIDYDTNTITLVSPETWSNNAPIWLYKKSDGKRVLYGTAPDMGAHEYEYNPPEILQQPASRAVIKGSDVSFQVVISPDSAATYQWRFNGSNINGETASTLDLTAVQESNEGEYTVVVTNPYGSIESEPAELKVYDRPPSVSEISKVIENYNTCLVWKNPANKDDLWDKVLVKRLESDSLQDRKPEEIKADEGIEVYDDSGNTLIEQNMSEGKYIYALFTYKETEINNIYSEPVTVNVEVPETYNKNITRVEAKPGDKGNLIIGQNTRDDLYSLWNSEKITVGVGPGGNTTGLWIYGDIVGDGVGQIAEGSKIISARLVFHVKGSSFNDNSGSSANLISGQSCEHSINVYRITDPDKLGNPYFADKSGIRAGLDYYYRDHRPGINIPWINPINNGADEESVKDSMEDIESKENIESRGNIEVKGSLERGDILKLIEKSADGESIIVDNVNFYPEVFTDTLLGTIEFDITDAVNTWVKGAEGSTAENQGLYISPGQGWGNGESLILYGVISDDGLALGAGVSSEGGVDECNSSTKAPYLEIIYADKNERGDLTPPDPVQEIGMIPDTDSITLNWTDPDILRPENTDFAGVKIVRKEGIVPYGHQDGDVLTFILADNNDNNNNYTDTAVETGHTYYYAIYSYDEALNFSNEGTSIKGTPGSPETAVVLENTGISMGAVNLKWNSVEGASSYRIYREDNSADINLLTEITAEQNQLSFVDYLLKGEYTYWMSAVNDYGEGPLSDKVSVLINDTNKASSKPDRPSGLSGSGVYGSNVSSDITLSWNDNSENESMFIIEREIEEGVWQEIGSTFFNVNEYSYCENISVGTYKYRVRAVNSAGSSEPCEVQIVIEKTGVTNISWEVISAAHIKMMWEDNSGTNSYLVELYDISNSGEIKEGQIPIDTQTVSGINYCYFVSLEPDREYQVKIKWVSGRDSSSVLSDIIRTSQDPKGGLF